MRWIHYSLLAVFSSAFLFAAESDFQDKAEFESVLKSLKGTTDISERVERASAAFLGKTFEWGPLGEGADAPYDSDPLARADKFDCTTYVETVSALVLSDGWESFMKTINQIRYAGGNIDFVTRNHFTELDWKKHNIEEEKFFEDITANVAPKEIKTAKTTTKKAAWFAKMERKSFKPAKGTDEKTVDKDIADLVKRTSTIANQPSDLEYIPYLSIIRLDAKTLEGRRAKEKEINDTYKADRKKRNEEMAKYRTQFLADHPDAINEEILDPKKIPSGTIVNYVHPERPLEAAIGTNMLVTHQGFLIWKNGKLFGRHAAFGNKVLDIPFAEYANIFLIPGPLDAQGINLNVIRK